MATRYWVTGPTDFAVGNDPAPTFYRLQLKVAYFGDQVPGFVIQDRTLYVEALFTDTPATIASKVIDAVALDAASIGLTVNRSAGLLPSYIRGS